MKGIVEGIFRHEAIRSKAWDPWACAPFSQSWNQGGVPAAGQEGSINFWGPGGELQVRGVLRRI